MPRYSFVIPTKDRPQLIGLAVGSVLSQRVDDWELVVCDNSDDEQTHEVLRGFDDPRVRYERTGGLSMPDNWEAALAFAQGEYLCVLQDKQVLHFDALSRLDPVVRDGSPQIVRWEWDEISSYGLCKRIRTHGGAGAVTRRSSRDALRVALEGSYFEGKALLPIPHYSAIRTDLLDEVRRGGTGRLCPPISPDITLAVQAANLVEEIVYLDASLVAFSDVSVSNGLSVRTKGKLADQFTRQIGGREVFCSHVPVKIRSVYGGIYNDLVKLRMANGGRLSELEPDWGNYYFGVHQEIQQAIADGVDMKPELDAWEEALREESGALRARVRDRVRGEFGRHSSLARRLRKSRAVQGVTRSLRSLLHAHVLRDPLWRCSDMLEYVEWRAQHARRR